jgi:hypothetical protein
MNGVGGLGDPVKADTPRSAVRLEECPDPSTPRRRRTGGRRALRLAAAVVYALALASYISTFGLPKQTLAAVAWIWAATVVWNIELPWRAHLTFLRDWWPPLVLLTVYLYSRGISDDLGFVAVHITEPITADRWMFGGVLPTEWLQGHLCGDPCLRSSQPRWYDVVLTTVYYSHFFVALGVAGWYWISDRAEWSRYMRRYLSITALALVTYIVCPMAPPWMASRDGYISDGIARITGRGWFDLGSGASSGAGGAHQEFSAVGNQVAAMPSLHAALAIFVAFYAMGRLSHGLRWLLLLYPLSMSFMLVYYAEHYVIDVLAGAVCVGVVMVGSARWERWLERRSRGWNRQVQTLKRNSTTSPSTMT